MKVSGVEASRSDRDIEDALLRPVFETGTRFYALVAALLVLVAIAAVFYTRQLRDGLVVAGMNQPVYWGLYITNYIFFIGISHAGTLISAILRITGADWRRPITRVAEVITVIALLMGSSNILWHLGRPELIYLPLLEPQFLSPLIWDVCAISLYLTGSIVYFVSPAHPRSGAPAGSEPSMERPLPRACARLARDPHPTRSAGESHRHHGRHDHPDCGLGAHGRFVDVVDDARPHVAHSHLRTVLRRRCHLQRHRCASHRDGGVP